MVGGPVEAIGQGALIAAHAAEHDALFREELGEFGGRDAGPVRILVGAGSEAVTHHGDVQVAGDVQTVALEDRLRPGGDQGCLVGGEGEGVGLRRRASACAVDLHLAQEQTVVAAQAALPGVHEGDADVARGARLEADRQRHGVAAREDEVRIAQLLVAAAIGRAGQRDRARVAVGAVVDDHLADGAVALQVNDGVLGVPRDVGGREAPGGGVGVLGPVHEAVPAGQGLHVRDVRAVEGQVDGRRRGRGPRRGGSEE